MQPCTPHRNCPTRERNRCPPREHAPCPPPVPTLTKSYAYLSTIAPNPLVLPPSPEGQFIVIAPQTQTSLGTAVTFGQNGGNILLEGQWGIPQSANGTTLLVGETGVYSINLEGFFQEKGPVDSPSYGAVSIFMTANGSLIANIVRDSLATAVAVSTGGLSGIVEASSTFITQLTKGTLLRFWATRLASEGAQEMVASSLSVLDALPPLSFPGNYQQPWYRVSIIKAD